jgi:site-specific DNA-adenine methylase
MTSYHGGKQKLGKVLANVISNTEGDYIGYCEPFCGMLGVYRHIPAILGDDIQYMAGDVNESVIMMWEEAKQGWIPPSSYTEDKYNIIKRDTTPSAEKGFVGHACSFGGQYMVGYKDKYLKSDTLLEKNNRLSAQSSRVCKIAKECMSIDFFKGDYNQFSHLKGFLIYCDPPYENVRNRYVDESCHSRPFDHASFWKWCKSMSKSNTILVSGFSAPEADFLKIWGLEKARTAHGSNSVTGVEGLYVIRSAL